MNIPHETPKAVSASATLARESTSISVSPSGAASVAPTAKPLVLSDAAMGDAKRRTPLFIVAGALLFLLFSYCAIFGWFVYRDGVIERTAVLQEAKGSLAGLTHYLLFSATMRPFELFSTMRYLIVFLGFTLTILGSLFVLAYAPAMYTLRVDTDRRALALESASPGLILATVGAVLVAMALYRSADPSLEFEGAPLPSSSASTISPASSSSAEENAARRVAQAFPGLHQDSPASAATAANSSKESPR